MHPQLFVGDRVMSCPRAGCGRPARPVRRAGKRKRSYGGDRGTGITAKAAGNGYSLGLELPRLSSTRRDFGLSAPTMERLVPLEAPNWPGSRLADCDYCRVMILCADPRPTRPAYHSRQLEKYRIAIVAAVHQ